VIDQALALIKRLKQAISTISATGQWLNRKYEGTGLGLALSRNNGYMDINVDSELGRGVALLYICQKSCLTGLPMVPTKELTSA